MTNFNLAQINIVHTIAKYESAVLTFVDSDGFPLSVRCVPEIDGSRQVIRLTLPPDITAQPAPPFNRLGRYQTAPR